MRSALSFSCGSFRWTEHVWWVTNTGNYFQADLDAMHAWFGAWAARTHGGFPPRAEGRCTLLPDVASADAISTIAIIGDLVEADTLLLDSVLGLIGGSASTALPGNVSKELEYFSDRGGKGRYGRIHTAGLTSDDLEADAVTMPPDRRQKYIDVYSAFVGDAAPFLSGFPDGAEIIDAPSQPFTFVNHHRKPWFYADDPNGWWSYVTSCAMRSPYVGTMQTRSPGHYRDNR